MLKGKSVLVTGGAKGIGRYIAHRFAGEGTKVAIADIDTGRMAQTLRELQDMGGEAFSVAADVRNEAQVQDAMGKTASHFGGIDILVNNAGIVPHFQWGLQRWPRVRDMDEEFWWKVIGTNLGGTFLCSKHVVPYMERAGGGHIVNLHGGGSTTPPGALAYIVSKEAIAVFTRCHAEEVRDANICVVAIGPGGAIATEDAPAEARAHMPGPELAGNRFLLAAEAPMTMSGHLLEVEKDELVIRA